LRTAEMYYARSGVLSAVARTARRRAEALPLDPEAFEAAVEEGQQLRRAFDAATAGMRR
jgi:hypothetical protein